MVHKLEQNLFCSPATQLPNTASYEDAMLQYQTKLNVALQQWTRDKTDIKQVTEQPSSLRFVEISK